MQLTQNYMSAFLLESNMINTSNCAFPVVIELVLHEAQDQAVEDELLFTQAWPYLEKITHLDFPTADSPVSQ